jgi:hypothetical protein
MRRLFVALLVVFCMTASGCAMFDGWQPFAGWQPFKTIRPSATTDDDEGSVFSTPSPR